MSFFGSSAPNWALDSWEKWSFFAVILSAVVNAGFLGALVWQVIQGRKALKAANKSANAARAAVKEATRARVDAKTPMVIAILDKPDIHGLSKQGEFRIEADPEFVLPRMKDDKLLLIVEGKLVNEGKATARVRLHGNGATYIDQEDGEDPLFVAEIPPSKEERILMPGQELRFVWSDGHKLSEWADAFNNPSPPNPRGACFMEIIVTDYLADGVIDHIHLEMSGRPIQPVEDDNGHWKLSKQENIVAMAYPIHRTYRGEGWKGLTPPWEKTYKKWADQHKKSTPKG